MREHHVVEAVLDAFVELTALHAAAVAAAEKGWTTLAKYDRADLRCAACPYRRSLTDRPMVNPTTFSVEWKGRRCALGPTIQFKLIQRLSWHTERYYSYDDLMENVWKGRYSRSTVRSAVKRLRQALYQAGMDDLAKAIKGRGECYGLILHQGGF